MHKTNTNLHRRENNWFINTTPLQEIISCYGTPLYLYDGEVIRQRFRQLKTALPWPGLQLYYAMKANYNPAVLQVLKECGVRLDTVSQAELLLALKAGFEPRQIIYTANNITDTEMRAIQKLGVLFNIGSLSRLEKFGKAFPGSEVCLRFNTGIICGDNPKVQTGGPKSKFGLNPDDRELILRIITEHRLQVTGLHEHTGSGIDDTDKFFQSMQKLLELANPTHFPGLRFIDLGGGITIPYREDARVIDYLAFGAKIIEIFKAFCRQYGRKLELYFEPGKYLSGEAGIFIIQVNTLKINAGRYIAGTNSGFPHLIRPVLYDAYHQILNLSNPGGARKTYDICGHICESGDLFATGRILPEIREGDYLAILNAGAYCQSMAGIYNLRPIPPEVMLSKDRHWLARKGLSPAELVAQIYGECL